jgi:hypothetical protein
MDSVIEFVPAGKGFHPVRHNYIYLFFFARHIANNSTFMDIATILWALTIEPARDDNGKYIVPDVDGYVNTGVLLWVRRSIDELHVLICL